VCVDEELTNACSSRNAAAMAYKPIGIAMQDGLRENLRDELLRRKVGDNSSITLRRVSMRRNTKRVLLVTKGQARQLFWNKFATITLSASQLRANKAHTDGFISSLLGDVDVAPRTSFEPVEIAMGELEETRLRNDLQSRKGDDDRYGGVTLRRVSRRTGSKKELLVTKGQARLLNAQMRYSTIPLSAKQLKANKAHSGGFIASLLDGGGGAAAAAAVDDETTDDGAAIVVDDDEDDERGVVEDRVFVRRNNQLARVKEYRGEEGRGLILVKATESDRKIASRRTADGLFLACKDNSVFTLSDCEDDHLFKILS
jgi:hypothetical protein